MSTFIDLISNSEETKTTFLLLYIFKHFQMKWFQFMAVNYQAVNHFSYKKHECTTRQR